MRCGKGELGLGFCVGGLVEGEFRVRRFIVSEGTRWSVCSDEQPA